MARALAWWLVVASVASPLHAQQRSAVAAVPPRHSDRCSQNTMGFRAFCEGGASMPAVDAGATAWSIAASAILPGSGQAILGANRALPYLAVEAFAWTSYVMHSVEYRRDRDGYRGLASRVARAAFSTVRPHGNFEYYERMTHYPEAGRYDLVTGGGIEPETDSTTYNGAMWLLARRTYWADPSIPPDTSSGEWKRAVAFYRARAYDQLYRWSWTNAPLEYSAFIDLIRESNDANRRALQDLGLIIANHVLSTVDAYITVRLRRQADAQGFALEGSIPLARFASKGKSTTR
ncbi:MAG TPA: hypothetical protein VIK50_07455 [Gemmatimonadaceae bacterium]